jgi:hypothetical protein
VAKIEIKDESRCYTSYSRADGSGVEDWEEEYVVLQDGVEQLRTRSKIEAERYAARLANTKARQKLRAGSRRFA